MNIKAVLFAATALCAPGLAMAQECGMPVPVSPNYPQPTKIDCNVRMVDYSPEARVRILSNPERVTDIVFGPNEQVSRISFGDAKVKDPGGQVWTDSSVRPGKPGEAEAQNSPLELRNVLTLWARRKGHSNLSVVTVVDEGNQPDRVYHFVTRVQPLPDKCPEGERFDGCCTDALGCDDPEATYKLIFRYPEQERQEKARIAREQAAVVATQAEERRQKRAQDIAVARLRPDHFAGGANRNVCWRLQGHEEIGPKRDGISDNNQELTLDFDGRPIPAFLRVRADNKDGEVVQPFMRGPLVAIQNFPDKLRLRLGTDKVADLIRCTPKQHIDYGTGTSSPDVVRVIQQQRPRRHQ